MVVEFTETFNDGRYWNVKADGKDIGTVITISDEPKMYRAILNIYTETAHYEVSKRYDDLEVAKLDIDLFYRFVCGEFSHFE